VTRTDESEKEIEERLKPLAELHYFIFKKEKKRRLNALTSKAGENGCTSE